jgi:hypothetical protein
VPGWTIHAGTGRQGRRPARGSPDYRSPPECGLFSSLPNRVLPLGIGPHQDSAARTELLVLYAVSAVTTCPPVGTSYIGRSIRTDHKSAPCLARPIVVAPRQSRIPALASLGAASKIWLLMYDSYNRQHLPIKVYADSCSLAGVIQGVMICGRQKGTLIFGPKEHLKQAFCGLTIIRNLAHGS